MPKTLTFTVSAENEEKLEELFNILQGHTEQFADENNEEMEWDRNAIIK